MDEKVFLMHKKDQVLHCSVLVCTQELEFLTCDYNERCAAI